MAIDTKKTLIPTEMHNALKLYAVKKREPMYKIIERAVGKEIGVKPKN